MGCRLKDKKVIISTNAFWKNSNESNCKPNKIWVDKDRYFYNRSMKWLLHHDEINMYSKHNEEKSVFAERFIRTLKDKIYKNMTLVSKKVYIDKLFDIVNKYNNIYCKRIKMKPADVNWSPYIDFGKENYDKDPKFAAGEHVRISK